MDGTNQILPIAYGVCKGESSECWTWFLSKLKECIGERENLVIISDPHPSVALAVRELFPNSFHGLCCTHLEMNLKLKSKSVRALYRKICKVYTVNEFSTLMSYLSDAQLIAFAKLSEVGYGRWSRAHCPANHNNYCTSNSAESMNVLSMSARKMPITMLIEFFREHVQEKYYEHRISGVVGYFSVIGLIGYFDHNNTSYKYGAAECTLIPIYYDLRSNSPKKWGSGDNAPRSRVQGVAALVGSKGQSPCVTRLQRLNYISPTIVSIESLQGELREWAAAKVEDEVLKLATWKTYGIDDTHYEVDDRKRFIVDFEN
uniref:uncharacterized protein LOC122609152 n=1 Tax=Erigeron canadensis TaxID=72917 RepID=UPI001CB96032|nr:uncharacterized protein LOC122609152 [Erigeron canadensis]